MDFKNFDLKKVIGFSLAILLPLLVCMLPAESFGVEGLTGVEQRIIAIFIFATIMWVFEPIPIWGTSVLVMALMLLTTSDSMLNFLKNDNVGQTLSYKSIMASFADPTVMLFMGGFVLAIGATKYGLDATLARIILKPFGKKPKFVMLDEPFAGVDPIAVQEIQDVVWRLKDKNIGILITDHNVDETLMITDRAYLLFEGKILFHGTPEELAANPVVRTNYLGRDFELKKKNRVEE